LGIVEVLQGEEAGTPPGPPLVSPWWDPVGVALPKLCMGTLTLRGFKRLMGLHLCTCL